MTQAALDNGVLLIRELIRSRRAGQPRRDAGDDAERELERVRVLFVDSVLARIQNSINK
ncbi:hypothetical protein JYU34_011644 [Plutella xylostella]|uniref:Uncharacterized protein n=1 Tax=Plutella xylostella TaxID=51655 RepID=A0ABQ7QD77_PLUXY|nr:hypothetical protein JYU34_011644 [Plutella xylostella]